MGNEKVEVVECNFEVTLNPSEVNITSSLDELKMFVDLVKASYVSTAITADNIKQAKEELAKFRKIKKQVSEKMKSVKEELLKNYNLLSKRVENELSRLDDIEYEMNSGIKAVLEAEKQAKHQSVVELITAESVKLNPEVSLLIKDYFDPRWENKTISESEILRDFLSLADNANATLSAIRGNKHESQLIGVFKNSYRFTDVQSAIERFKAEDAEMEKFEKAREKAKEEQAQRDYVEAVVFNNKPEAPAPAPAPAIDKTTLIYCTFECCGTIKDIATTIKYGRSNGAIFIRTSEKRIATPEQVARFSEV